MVETTRWDPGAMRDLAHAMRSRSLVLRTSGAQATATFNGVGRSLPVETRLIGVTTWIEHAAADVDERAAQLEAADRMLQAMVPFAPGFGFGIAALLTETPDRIRRLEAELQAMTGYGVPPEVRAAVREELRLLRLRRVSELGLLAIVDPATDSTAEFARLAEQLGITTDTVDAVIDSMAVGMSPEEAGLPALLFSPSYRSRAKRDLEPLLARVAELEQRQADRLAVVEAMYAMLDDGATHHEVLEALGEFPMGPDLELHEISVDLAYATHDLEEARRELAETPMDTMAWLLSLPFARDLVAPAVGRRLAVELLDDSGKIEPIAAILDEVESVALDHAFAERLGAEGFAMVPTWAVAEAEYGNYDETVDLLRVYAESLAQAAETGLSYSGADVVWPEDAYWMVPPAELLRMAEFPTDFLVDAASVLIQVYGGNYIGLFSTGPIALAPGPEFNQDPRAIVLSQLATSTEANALLERLIADDLVTEFVDPSTPYGDAGWDLAAVVAAVRRSDTAVAALIPAIADADSVTDPLALGAVALLDGNMSLLIPTGIGWDADAGDYAGIDRFDYDHDDRVGGTIREADVDQFLAVILDSDLATSALINDFGRFVRSDMASTPPRDLQDRVDELGAAAGRIVRIRNEALIRHGADEDDRLAFTGVFVSVLGGVAIAVGTGGLGAVAAIGAGAAGDVIIDVGFDQLFPADNESTALRAALGDDTFDLEVWRYLVVEAIWNQSPDFFGSTPPPIELDGTLSSLAGPTMGEGACYAADPDALTEWYTWLHSLPDDLQLAVDAIADTAHSRMAEEARFRISD